MFFSAMIFNASSTVVSGVTVMLCRPFRLKMSATVFMLVNFDIDKIALFRENAYGLAGYSMQTGP
jgi:hypothetical protein